MKVPVSLHNHTDTRSSYSSNLCQSGKSKSYFNLLLITSETKILLSKQVFFHFVFSPAGFLYVHQLQQKWTCVNHNITQFNICYAPSVCFAVNRFSSLQDSGLLGETFLLCSSCPKSPAFFQVLRHVYRHVWVACKYIGSEERAAGARQDDRLCCRRARFSPSSYPGLGGPAAPGVWGTRSKPESSWLAERQARVWVFPLPVALLWPPIICVTSDLNPREGFNLLLIFHRNYCHWIDSLCIQKANHAVFCWSFLLSSLTSYSRLEPLINTCLVVERGEPGWGRRVCVLCSGYRGRPLTNLPAGCFLKYKKSGTLPVTCFRTPVPLSMA